MISVAEARQKYYDHFYGNEISDYGMQHGYVDYRCLSHCGDMVLCNAMESRFNYSAPVLGSATYEDEDGNEIPEDIYQWYIISDGLFHVLEHECPNEIVFYDEELDIYVWAITHWGTSWDYVLTDIPLRKREE